MNLRTTLAPALTLVALASAAEAHYDIRPYTASGKIQLGGHDDGTGDSYKLDSSGNPYWVSTPAPSDSPPPPNVFGFDFQEEIEDPYFIGDPGFNAQSGDLPGSTAIRFRALPIAGSQYLAFWDGTGPVAFSDPIAGENLRLQYGSQSITLDADSLDGWTGTTTYIPNPTVTSDGGFTLQTTTSAGTMHRHLGSLLAGGGTPTDGIYLIQLQLYSSSLQSDPFWVVYNNGLDEEVHDQAIASLVPEPASLAVAVVAGLGLLRRVRRS